MPARGRPISPFWIYRWQIGNTLSILHRFTGAALALGLIALSYWLVSVAEGPQRYAAAVALFASPAGLLLLIGWTFAFMFHLLNGVRHLRVSRFAQFSARKEGIIENHEQRLPVRSGMSKRSQH